MLSCSCSHAIMLLARFHAAAPMLSCCWRAIMLLLQCHLAAGVPSCCWRAILPRRLWRASRGFGPCYHVYIYMLYWHAKHNHWSALHSPPPPPLFFPRRATPLIGGDPPVTSITSRAGNVTSAATGLRHALPATHLATVVSTVSTLLAPKQSTVAGSDPKHFRMASSLPPVPAKLVRHIQAGEFVEMRDLLPDNLALAERLEALPARPGQPSKASEQREIGSLVTWVSCFATYVAIVSEVHPEHVVDMLAYLRLVVREANRYGGNGWLTYDAVFRRNQQGETRPWNFLDSSLHTAYIAGQGSGVRVPCKFCNEADHAPGDCALASLAPATKQPRREGWAPHA